MRGIIFGLNPEDIFLAGRSARSLAAHGVTAGSPVIGEEAIASKLRLSDAPVMMLQCGGWLAEKLPARIPPSATGLPLIAWGQTEGEQFPNAGSTPIPTPLCLYLEVTSARKLATLLQSQPWNRAVHTLLENPDFRSVWLPSLASFHDPKLRILQVVTTIQIGGAEKVTLNLAEGLRGRGHNTWVAALAAPMRRAYPDPPAFFDLSKVDRAPHARAGAIARLAQRLHADLIHAHLISGAESEALHSSGFPLVITMHNMPQSWPHGFHTTAKKAGLLVACSQTVARAMLNPGSPCRVAWNGIPEGCYSPTPERREKAAAWRLENGWSATDFVVISVANPRRQKRLDRIPEILAELQKKLPDRKVRCIFAGEASNNADAREADAALTGAIAQSGMASSILSTGASDEIPLLLNASDAFLSTSSFEGLSLSHLEALAAGLPVVTTDVGGASEIARELGGNMLFYKRLPVDAPAVDFANALFDLPVAARASRLPPAFQVEKMAHRMEQLYRVTLVLRDGSRKHPEGLWLVTNNFSMGGAQSSARRLLEELKNRGIKVRAFTVQEERPTCGSDALKEAGVPVTHIPPSARLETARGVARILAMAANRPPEGVLFWNLIASYKLLLADGLEGIPVFDISPGEMNFHSLAQYFRNPRPELPCRSGLEYGANLAGTVVKFEGEKQTAETLLGIPVSVIPNGVPMTIRKKTSRPGKLIFGTAARISPDKRLEDLIEAFTIAHASLPPYELHIAGRVENGATVYADSLREKAKGLPIIWRGELPGTADFLAGLDVFTMISEPAGCPNASLEAMAAGLPVIGTDVGGAREQIVDGKTGRLTPARDNHALAEAIIELAHDAKARSRYGNASRRRIVKHFSMKAMADRYTQLCLPNASPSHLASEVPAAELQIS